ncbi:MAG: MATE family efflux transporter [Treponema sp.]|nr:MAG: MATE family efflux transporter [Treponema sp.]
MRKTDFFGDISFYKKALQIALPVIGQLLIQTLITLIDNFMVARLGDVKMSGVNVSNHLVFVLLIALYALASAGGIFMAQYSGAKDKDGMQQAFRFKIVTMSFIAVISGVLAFTIPEKLMALMLGENLNASEIINEGRIYLIIASFAFLPTAVSSAMSSSFREVGNVKAPLYISITASVVNAFGNYVLIYGNFGVPRLEVAGAAYATLFARIFEMIAFIVYAKKTNAPFYVKAVHVFNVKVKLFKDIFKKSAWLFISEITWVVVETIISAVYNRRGGSEVVAGMASGWAITEVFFVTYTGIGVAVTVIIGGLLGGNKIAEARKKALWLENGSIIVGILNGLIQALSVFVFIPLFFGALSCEAQTVARHLIWVVSLYMPVWTFQHAQYAVLRAGGDSFSTAWIETVINLACFLPVLFLVYRFTNFGAVIMYGIVKLSSLVKPLLCANVLKKERWLNNLTLAKKD